MNTVSIHAGAPYEKVDQTISSVLKIDAKTYLNDLSPKAVQQFSADNRFGYRVAITTWLVILDDADRELAWEVFDLIRSFGLVKVISQACQASDAMIRNDVVPAPWKYMTGGLKSKLQLLRFLKRFTPIGAEKLHEASIASFLAIQEHLWYWASTHDYLWGTSLIRDIADEVNSLLVPFSTIKDFGRFTPGSVLGCGPSLTAKADGLIACDPEAFRRGAGAGIPTLQNTFSAVPPCRGKGKLAEDAYRIFTNSCTSEDYAYTARSKTFRGTEYIYTLRPVRERSENVVMAVPKSYKTSRLIAPETPLRQWNANRMASTLENHFSPTARQCIPLHDQGVNCEGARIGSIDNSLATIDQSSASDSISECLIRHVFPMWYLDLLDKYSVRSAYSTVSGKVTSSYTRVNPDQPRLCLRYKADQSKSSRVKLQTHLTSGNSLTFIHESILFCAIARVSVRYALLWTAGWDSDTAIQEVDKVRVYGDDTIIPDYAAETYCDILAILGFTPNRQKSYWGMIPFRESCGEEWYGGCPVHSVYWPRKEINCDMQSLPSLISLQHRFGGYANASRFLAAVCRSILPSLTSHTPQEGVGDLWEARPRYKYTSAPIDRQKAKPEFLHGLSEAIRIANLYGDPAYAGSLPLRDKNGHTVDVPWASFIREKHSALCPVYPTVKGSQLTGNIGLYCYRIFLEEGPYFNDPFLELLGISAPRHSAAELAVYHWASDLRYEVRASLE